jgi:hypothetical protein
VFHQLPLVATWVKYVRYLNFRRELSNAQMLWQENRLSDYEIVVTGNKFFGNNDHPCTLSNQNIIFENELAVVGNNLEECQTFYNEIAVSKFFEHVSSELSGINIILTDWTIEFDKEYGYVTFYRVDYQGSVLFPNKNSIGIFPESVYDFKAFGIVGFSPIK